MRVSYFGSSLNERRLAQCVRQAGHSLFLKNKHQFKQYYLYHTFKCTVICKRKPTETCQVNRDAITTMNQIKMRLTYPSRIDLSMHSRQNR